MAVQRLDRTKLWLTGLMVSAIGVVAFATEDQRHLDFQWKLATFAAIVSIALAFYHYRALIRRPILIAYYFASLLAFAVVFYLFSLLPQH